MYNMHCYIIYKNPIKSRLPTNIPAQAIPTAVSNIHKKQSFTVWDRGVDGVVPVIGVEMRAEMGIPCKRLTLINAVLWGARAACDGNNLHSKHAF